MSTKLKLLQQAEARRRRRYWVLGLIIIVVAAVIFFGPALREQEPDYYNPARIALVNARMRFEESLGHEQALIEQLQMVHKELGSAIVHLAKAADLDPADRARIEAMRSTLESLENPERLRKASPEKLQQSYRELLAQMETMIEDLDNRKR